MSKSVSVLISNVACRGGLERYAVDLAGAFKDEGCDVKIVTTNTSDKSINDIEVVNLGERASLNHTHIKQFERWSREWTARNPSDIVFSVDRTTKQTHYWAGIGTHAAYLEQRTRYEPLYKRIGFKFFPAHRSKLAFERQAYEDPELRLLLTNSNLVRDEILHHYDVAPEKVQVVHNGIAHKAMEEDFSQWERRRPQILDSLELDPSAYQFLFVGHGFTRKGLGFILQALPYLKHQNWQLSVVGKDKQLSRYKQIVKRLGLGERVKFFGPRTNTRSFYQMADAVLIPSTYDPFASVTIEGPGMGLYVVTSLHNGGHEVIEPTMGNIVQDLFSRDSMISSLDIALDNPKTGLSALDRRERVRHLDFSSQLKKVVQKTLETA